MKINISYLLISFFLCFLVFFVVPVYAQDDGKIRELEQKIVEYGEKIDESRTKQRTLASTIEVLDNKVALTIAKINKTTQDIVEIEKQIKGLDTKIESLEYTLTDITKLLDARIQDTYKRSYVPEINLFLGHRRIADFISNFQYVKSVQKRDKEILFNIEETKQTFDKQKFLKEKKQEELKSLEDELTNQSTILTQQKYAKQYLLEITKNDEKKFQSLLSQARSEFEAIQAIISKKGEETKVSGDVKAGDKIASVIQGASCNSAGAHLHFTVVEKSGATRNPFDFLKPVDFENCSGPGSCSPGDPFNPSGSWNWPIAPKISFNQGYGRTWAVNNTWVGQVYSFHNGLDILGSSPDVRAVADGTLYRGSYRGVNGCNLRYVRIEHKDSNLSTFYLHVNY